MSYIDDYVKTNWVNYPSTTTPINQTNLNHLEGGVKTNCGRIANLDTTKANQSDLLATFKTVTFDSSTGVFTFTKWDGTATTINTDIEKIAINFDYDDDPTSPHYQNLVLELSDGTYKYIDLSALITEYEFDNTSTIAFSIAADGTVTANVVDGSITANKLQPNYLADCVAAQTAAETAESGSESERLKAEGFAVGEQNGVPVSSGPYFHNNAKYYAQQSGGTALSALTDVTISAPQDGDTLAYDSATQKWINVAAGPTPVTVTLTLNGAKNDVITVKDSNNQTVGTCAFAAGQTSGTVQIDVPAGGGTYKFISSVAKIKSGGSFVDYEKTVALSDAVSQTVNVYPKNAFYWYGKDINNITHDGYSWNGATTYAANKDTNYVEFTQSNFQLMGTANAIDFTPFNALHFIIESNISTVTTGGGLNTTKTSISAGGNLSKYADFPGSNNAKADVELDVTSINQSAYIFMVDGSNTSHSCKVYAIFGDDGHEDDITIHGAKEDTITIKDIDDQTVATCIFGSGQTVGYVSKALLPSGTYTFTSSVAKDTTTGTSDYEKTITLDGSESEVKVYPDGALYWYGNKVNVTTFWGNNSDNIQRNTAPPDGSITENTNNIVCAGGVRRRGICSSTTVTGTTLKGFVTTANVVGDGTAQLSENANDTTMTTRVNITSINTAQTDYIISGSITSGNYAILSQYNVDLTIKALWGE